MNFRFYEERDLDAMYALDVECFEPPFRYSLEDIRDFASEFTAVSIVAEDEGKVVGFFIAEAEYDSAYLVTLDVALTYRRRGLGRQLLAEAERAFPQVDRLVLHVFQGNEPAIRFYEASGYRRVGEEKGFYGPGRDAWIYMRELGRV